MKRITLTVVLTVFLSCFFAPSAYSWIFIDPTGVPGLDIRGLLDTVRQIDDVITKNFKNYPAAFALSNVGGDPIGGGYIGNFPHMFFGVSMTIGCANMKYFDEDVRRETSVYPAYAPNPVLYLGLGLAGGFYFVIKGMG